MDTSDLSERFFDENTILYNIADRNEIVFGEREAEESKKEETITFTPGPGVTAIVHGQDGEPDRVVSGGAEGEIYESDIDELMDYESDSHEPEGSSMVVSMDPEEQMLISLWRLHKESHPESTIEEFYEYVMETNSEVDEI
jgi:hypothetical protein